MVFSAKKGGSAAAADRAAREQMAKNFDAAAAELRSGRSLGPDELQKLQWQVALLRYAEKPSRGSSPGRAAKPAKTADGAKAAGAEPIVAPPPK
jgi:hypothetical protein